MLSLKKVLDKVLANLYIFEEKDGWICKKYANGTYECWTKKTFSVTTSINYSDKGKYSTTHIYFPIVFSEPPVCLAYGERNNSGIPMIPGIKIFTDNVQMFIYDPHSYSGTITANIHAIGK